MINSLIVCKAKVLGARVSDAHHKYWASLWVDADVLKAAHVYDYEKVLVVNLDNGARFETYVRSAPSGSKSMILAGGTAMLGKTGDEIGFLVFALVPEEQILHGNAKVVLLKPDNSIKSITDGDPGELA